jgi:hypothetical protein
LTERLSDGKLARLAERLHDSKERQALIALADASAFLPPPASEIPADPPPDPSAQARMVSAIEAYLANSMARLPDLLATRTTVRYQENLLYNGDNRKISYEPLHVSGTSTSSVRYSHGAEVADRAEERAGADAGHAQKRQRTPKLVTYGTFGPMLVGILDAITRQGELTWSRWDEPGAARTAVFRFTIPQERSRYVVGVCCLADGDGTQPLEQTTGYHGEIAVDPATGTILRLTYQATLPSTTPLASSAVMIQYGPVEIGGKTYVCPIHGISLMRARSVEELGEWDESFLTYGPFATMVNDMRFTSYHVFRSESRMLPGVLE